jgi:hypothetical protein
MRFARKNLSRKSEGRLGATAPRFRKKSAQKGLSNNPAMPATFTMIANIVKTVMKTICAAEHTAAIGYASVAQKRDARNFALTMKRKYAKSANRRLMYVTVVM